MTSPVIGTPWKKLEAPVSEEALEGVDKYWRASNYLSIGQIYLRSNPLMKEPFTREDVKHRLVGHWGTTPGLNFLIGHINRLIADHGQNTVIIMGPGHGGPAGTAQSYLDGTYTEYFPEITKDEALPPVLLPRWYPISLCSRDPRFHPRRWRTRLRSLPRLWRCYEQPKPLRSSNRW